jgi:hypothetical protein
MILKKLEIQGFKSFAERTEVSFSPGVIAVVGPNGSGKSNISDALLWVLGEQNVRNIRGEKAQDVIFNGTDKRRAVGMAEVSLTVDNTSGKLPINFAEVTVTRRAFRSGESEFFINKTACRLKDIYELFLDTGVGWFIGRMLPRFGWLYAVAPMVLWMALFLWRGPDMRYYRVGAEYQCVLGVLAAVPGGWLGSRLALRRLAVSWISL